MINTLHQQCRCSIFFRRCQQANASIAVARRGFHNDVKLNPSLLNPMCLLRVHQPVDPPRGKVMVSSPSFFLSPPTTPQFSSTLALSQGSGPDPFFCHFSEV